MPINRNTSSAELIAESRDHVLASSWLLASAYNDSVTPVNDLDNAERHLIEALGRVRVARWGILRRMPSFDEIDLAILTSRETAILKGYKSAGDSFIAGSLIDREERHPDAPVA